MRALGQLLTVRTLIGLLAVWQGITRVGPLGWGRSTLTFGSNLLFGLLILGGGLLVLATCRNKRTLTGRLAAAFLAAGWLAMGWSLAGSNVGSAGAAVILGLALLVEATVGTRC